MYIIILVQVRHMGIYIRDRFLSPTPVEDWPHRWLQTERERQTASRLYRYIGNIVVIYILAYMEL